MKKRLDIAVLEKGLTPSRESAKALIMAGKIYVNGQKADKPGTDINENDLLELRGETLRYVSRGGLKLEKAIAEFGVTLSDSNCMDIGASTGGFTDCMLQNGACAVTAVDVGYGQFAWKLRSDPRVTCLERTNIRTIDEAQFEKFDFVSIDVSFISLTLVLPKADSLLKTGGEIICLIKPQFEAGREKVGKKGVVRDPQVHFEVIKKVLDFAVSLGLEVKGLTYSPIKGPEGNIEYLAYLAKTNLTKETDSELIGAVVEKSHSDIKD